MVFGAGFSQSPCCAGDSFLKSDLRVLLLLFENYLLTRFLFVDFFYFGGLFHGEGVLFCDVLCFCTGEMLYRSICWGENRLFVPLFHAKICTCGDPLSRTKKAGEK